MEFVSKSFKGKQHLLIKLLFLKLYHYYVKSAPIILLSEFTIWMKRDFSIGIFLIKLQFILSFIIIFTNALCRLEPDRTLATRRLSGRKKNKERLSIALCANADGSHKLPPLIIGKYANPRCFKNIDICNLPMTYRNNNKAWMLTTLFQDWLHDFDRQVGQKHRGQRVLLLLDNCTNHKIEGLDLLNVDVHFLPPNTTSKIQPMDAGIIMSFKKHYRYYHIRYIFIYL